MSSFGNISIYDSIFHGYTKPEVIVAQTAGYFLAVNITVEGNNGRFFDGTGFSGNGVEIRDSKIIGNLFFYLLFKYFYN